jgi:hypothetical protein
VLAGASLLLAGCAAPAGPPFTVLGTDARLLIGDAPRADLVTRGIEVRRVSHLIFWVPTKSQEPTVMDAVGEALSRGNGDLLVNASVRRVAWYVPFLYGEYGWVVRGDVVRLRYPRSEALRESRTGDFDPQDRPGAAPDME